MKFGSVVIVYSILTFVVHILFVVYSFMQRPIECIPVDRLEPIRRTFELFIVWSIVYFPLLLLCVLYTLLFRMSRSFLCSCWRCCGQDIYSKGATKCKICIEGWFGNPLIFVLIFIAWGIYEYTAFTEHDCAFEIQYGFLADLVLVSLSLLLLCVFYTLSVKKRFEQKRAEIAAANQHHPPQHQEDDNAHFYDMHHGGGHPSPNRQHLEYNIQAPNEFDEGGRSPANLNVAPVDRRFSAQPYQAQNMVAPPMGRPYAASAIGIAPYQPDDANRRRSFQPMALGHNGLSPVYASSAVGIAAYQPQNDAQRRHSFQPMAPRPQPLPVTVKVASSSSHAQTQARAPQRESMSIEVSVESGAGHVARTRGESLSFPSEFRGHARRVSSGVLNILHKVEDEPECSICYGEFEKGKAMGQLECGHTFHKECIVEWLANNASCPICRQQMKR
eukprot:CAMPEP_0202710208 /NCGR_PEP_ID=MMETSP1385-20130828/22229_1 /ASSEMBLY_ACC=CAM_ASM_000861 /TAXON_ID=933848 /ORGANISM="Elphidium margaritaceum" /LENGTH=444 /DNA_ID=CAMNT_0049369691 /DNA_START=48 /DNA_END=1382 /DNA_ORIENTATION=+